MLCVELHCHTIYSRDSLLSIEKLIKTCQRKGIARVAITDHNMLAGALLAKSIAPEIVIMGEEILTSEGEILAYFVTKEVVSGLSPEETINRLRDQGAFVGVSHPFDRYRKGAWSKSSLNRILPLLDCIETFNARCIHAADNYKALEFASRHQILGIAGSDAHIAWEIGITTMFLPEFHDPLTLKHALQQAKIRVRKSPFWVHFFSRYSSWYKDRMKLRQSPS